MCLAIASGCKWAMSFDMNIQFILRFVTGETEKLAPLSPVLCLWLTEILDLTSLCEVAKEFDVSRFLL